MDKYTFVKHVTSTQDPLNSFDLYKDESDQQFLVQRLQLKSKTFSSFSQEDSNLVCCIYGITNRFYYLQQCITTCYCLIAILYQTMDI